MEFDDGLLFMVPSREGLTQYENPLIGNPLHQLQEIGGIPSYIYFTILENMMSIQPLSSTT